MAATNEQSEANRKDLADAIAGATVRLRNTTVGEWQLSEEAKGIIIASLRSATPANEYICKCGVRVVPHRCQTGEEF